MKKISKQEKKYTDNDMSVILERVESQFKVFGEGQSLLIDKFDKFEIDVKNQFIAFGEGQDILANKVDKIDERLENVEVKVDAIDERLEKVEVKVDKIDNRLENVEDNIIEIKHKFSEKVDLEDFQKLEKRFVKLEKIVFEKI